MKKIYFTIFLITFIGFCSSIYGQGPNTFPENGNVGLGVLSPAEKLSIAGNVIWDGYNSGNPRAVKIGYSGGNYGGIGYNIDFTGSTGIFNRPFPDRSSYLEFFHGGFRFFGTGTSNAAQNININGSDDNLSLLGIFLNSGNFGIGTGIPMAKFSVSNNGAEGLEIQPGSSINSTSIGAYNRSTNSYNDLVFNTSNVDFRSDLGVSRLNIQNSSGNIGIGTTNPTHKLTIDGDIKINSQSNGLMIRYATLSESVGGASTILGNNIKAGLGDNTIKRFSNGGDAGSFVSLNYSSGITFHTGVNSLLDTEVPSLEKEVMRITHSGNVGIGTSDSKGYKLAVNGKIRSQEIKVENTNWPDYVFEKSYSLPTLTETESHIKEKGHLQDIPSAAEVRANGVDLGEMNAMLLKKIEELTLHLIELNKMIQLQNIRILDQEKNAIEYKKEIRIIKSKL